MPQRPPGIIKPGRDRPKKKGKLLLALQSASPAAPISGVLNDADAMPPVSIDDCCATTLALDVKKIATSGRMQIR